MRAGRPGLQSGVEARLHALLTTRQRNLGGIITTQAIYAAGRRGRGIQVHAPQRRCPGQGESSTT